jgi:secernin
MGCDTLVALAGATRAGVTIFAKNSDRPPREAQGIVQQPRRRYPRGTTVRVQYLELPQVEQTAALIGSQPHWLWGFEHGVNEYRVAIGNETVFTKEPLGGVGLLGMDLVRLGLERSRTATEALEVMTALLERHGQGGSGQAHLDWPYHNAFLIADPVSAWVLETSDRHWVARRVEATGNISNGLALRADWERGSADVTRFAVERGWWGPNDGPVDFAAAYADDSTVPPNVCVERRRRGAALLQAAGRGGLTVDTFRAVLRDHYDSGPIHRPRPFDDPFFFSLCMHADPLDNTTASLVVSLPAEPQRFAPAWISLGSPCVGAFIPLYMEGDLPVVLGMAPGEPSAESPWWRLRALLSLVEQDVARHAPSVRAIWDVFETTVGREAALVEAQAAAQPAQAGPLLTEFMARTTVRYLAQVDALVAELEAIA